MRLIIFFIISTWTSKKFASSGNTKTVNAGSQKSSKTTSMVTTTVTPTQSFVQKTKENNGSKVTNTTMTRKTTPSTKSRKNTSKNCFILNKFTSTRKNPTNCHLNLMEKTIPSSNTMKTQPSSTFNPIRSTLNFTLLKKQSRKKRQGSILTM